MKRIRNLVLIGSSAVFFACSPSPDTGEIPSTKGARVLVYKTQEGGYQLKCQDNREMTSLGALWVGEYCDAAKKQPCVTGNVKPEDKKIILQAVKAYVDESKYLVPVVDSTKGDVPRLRIEVAALDVKKDKQNDRIIEIAEFEGYINVRKPILSSSGNVSWVECRSSKPVYEKVVFQAPTYKKAALPTERELKFKVMKKAVADVIGQFVPQSFSMLRPVKDDTERAKKLASMIDAGNYAFAIKKGEEILKSDKKAYKDAAFLYNLGVAYEARASQFDGQLDKQIELLKKAKYYYEQALNVNSNDRDINKAYSDVDTGLRALEESYKAQTKTRL